MFFGPPSMPAVDVLVLDGLYAAMKFVSQLYPLFSCVLVLSVVALVDPFNVSADS
jgi:hypothetical protein